MSWDAIGAISEIIAAAAVLVTLIYLAVQIRQTRKMQLAEAIRAARAERIDFFIALRDSPFIPEIFEKHTNGIELSFAESHRLMVHHAAAWAQLYSAWLQDKLDLSGGHNTNMEANFRFALGMPGAKDFLDEYGRNLYPEEFIEEAMMYNNDAATSVATDADA